jgi:hypothetical protein
MKNTVSIVFYELKSNPSDDWGVEEVCADRKFADKEIERLSKEFLNYRFQAIDYEIIK